jgi:hypothetical protein
MVNEGLDVCLKGQTMPKHGLWLNIVECELSVLSRKALQGRFSTKEALKEQV